MYDGKEVSYFSLLSRSICHRHALCIARIFEQHNRRFKTRQMFITGIQHAGTAATTLIAQLTLVKDPEKQVMSFQHLNILIQTLKEMSPTYQPAERMFNVLEDVIQGAGWQLDNLHLENSRGLVGEVPKRRLTPEYGPSEPASKRRRVEQPERVNTPKIPYSPPQSQPTDENFLGLSDGHIFTPQVMNASSMDRPDPLLWVNTNCFEDMMWGADRNGRTNFGETPPGHNNHIEGVSSNVGDKIVMPRVSAQEAQTLYSAHDIWPDVLRQVGF